MKTLSAVSMLILVLMISCSKNSSSGTPVVTPSNISINAVVSNDSSGHVSFTTTATNAVSYDYYYGDNTSQTGVTGTVVHTYSYPGTYTVTVTAKSTGGQTSTQSTSVVVAVALTLVWSDEFDIPGSPDPAKWGFDIGTGVGGWGNNELEYYTNRPDNAIVSNGTLKIIAKKESYNTSSYTSARMLTNNLYAFKYGRIDVRAKLPASAGTWPAIWMLGSNLSAVGWPACGEIDIAEQSGSKKSTIYGTMHYPTEVNQNGDGSTTSNPTASSDFHIYSALWTPAAIQLSVDGSAYYTLSNSPGLPFNQNFFVLLNIAMGGNFGGTVDPAFSTDQMEVDYVRVYQ